MGLGVDVASLSATKNKRRSKKDKIGRNFLCGCGKQYLSYPALYTHIKTKHSSVEPPGTIKPNNVHKSKGRPPKSVDFLLLLYSPKSANSFPNK